MALRHTLIPPTFSPMGEGESKVIKWVSIFQNCTGHCQRSPIFLALPETLKGSVRLRGGERLEAGWTELRRIQISLTKPQIWWAGLLAHPLLGHLTSFPSCTSWNRQHTTCPTHVTPTGQPPLFRELVSRGQSGLTTALEGSTRTRSFQGMALGKANGRLPADSPALLDWEKVKNLNTTLKRKQKVWSRCIHRKSMR